MTEKICSANFFYFYLRNFAKFLEIFVGSLTVSANVFQIVIIVVTSDKCP